MKSAFPQYLVFWGCEAGPFSGGGTPTVALQNYVLLTGSLNLDEANRSKLQRSSTKTAGAD